MTSRAAVGVQRELTPGDLDILGRAADWTSVSDLVVAETDRPSAEVHDAIEALVREGILESDAAPPSARATALRSWGAWHPVVSAYHFAIRDIEYRDPMDPTILRIIAKPYPSPVKQYGEAPQILLPDFRRTDAVTLALQQRRSWRRFDTSPLPFEDLVVLLGNTWAVQHWVEPTPGRPFAYKTSPSGGARHSLEVYVAASNVAGLEPGLYHYGPDEHALTRLWEGAPPLSAFFPGQPWFHEAPAAVFMASVFERVLWRYPGPSSYRTIYIEAGHFAQSFCLLATQRELAPFVTAALAHSIIEEHLALDALEESVVYAVGVGNRPPDTAWAPYPPPIDPPVRRAPAYAGRLDSNTERNASD